MLRALGVGAALLVPVGGLTLAGGGIAGASSNHVSVGITFPGLGSVSCGTQKWHTPLTCTGDFVFTPVAATVANITKTTVVTKKRVVAPLLTFESGSCRIRITGTIGLSGPSDTFYSGTVVLNNTVTPLPPGDSRFTTSGECPNLQGQQVLFSIGVD
jgi:hypothetical protein